jgi:hypothetical protein
VPGREGARHALAVHQHVPAAVALALGDVARDVVALPRARRRLRAAHAPHASRTLSAITRRLPTRSWPRRPSRRDSRGPRGRRPESARAGVRQCDCAGAARLACPDCGRAGAARERRAAGVRDNQRARGGESHAGGAHRRVAGVDGLDERRTADRPASSGAPAATARVARSPNRPCRSRGAGRPLPRRTSTDSRRGSRSSSVRSSASWMRSRRATGRRSARGRGRHGARRRSSGDDLLGARRVGRVAAAFAAGWASGEVTGDGGGRAAAAERIQAAEKAAWRPLGRRGSSIVTYHRARVLGPTALIGDGEVFLPSRSGTFGGPYEGPGSSVVFDGRFRRGRSGRRPGLLSGAAGLDNMD